MSMVPCIAYVYLGFFLPQGKYLDIYELPSGSGYHPLELEMFETALLPLLSLPEPVCPQVGSNPGGQRLEVVLGQML